MNGILAVGIADWPVFHQLAWVFGKVMNFIYNVLDGVFNIQNIGLCIIIFTLIIYTLMIPLTIKQQKWSKMSSVMQPELMKIRKKYAGKTDQVSMMKQQEEMQMVYDKYGTSVSGGCLPLLIQMPVLFSLYPVVQEIPNYITRVKQMYMNVVTPMMNSGGFQAIMEEIGSAKPIMLSPSRYDYSTAETLVNVLYRFQDSSWNLLVEKMPGLADVVRQTTASLGHYNFFFGINLADAPINMLTASLRNFSILGIILAVIIPVLSGLTQFLSVKLVPQPATASDNSLAGSMKTMNIVMPLFSVFIGFTLPAGLGLFWAASAGIRAIQQVFINKHIDKIPLEQIIKENQKKATKRRKKKDVPASDLNRLASTSTKKYETHKSDLTEAEREKLLSEARAKSQNARTGSLADRANMVRRFNEGRKSDDTKNEKEN